MKALIPFTLFAAHSAMVFAAPTTWASFFALLAFAWLAVTGVILRKSI